MKKSVKSRILAVFLACMAVVCMAVPAMAMGEMVQCNPTAGVHKLSNGDTVYCSGKKHTHLDIITYQVDGQRRSTSATHSKYNGTWYVDYTY